MRTRLTVTGLAIAVSLSAMGATALQAHAGGPTVNGAGSTWVQIALDQWRADIAQQGYSVDYQGVGSTTGRSYFIANRVDFAASEIPFQPGESPNRAFEYLPDVAGGTSLMYNLHDPAGNQITNLRLDADAVARIFTGKMTSWTDPEIAALNPGLAIAARDDPITAVVRSDGSGTSAQLSLYLASQAPAVWNAFVNAWHCAAPCSQWPPDYQFQAQSGSDGVAATVASPHGDGSIGYVEYGYARGYSFPVASLENASGNFTQPTAVDVATALQHAQFYPDNTQNLSGVYVAPESNAYAMSSYSYLIVQTGGFDPAKGNVLGRWLIYIACGGQKDAAPLGYSPLPPVLIQNVFDAEHRIPGAPPTPPIDKVNCPNPTVANAPGTAATGVPISNYGGATRSGGPAATAAASASASAAATADSTASATAAAVKTLGAKQRAAAFLAAEQATEGAAFGPRQAMLIAGAVVLVGVFAPFLLGWRRRASATRGGGGDG